MNEFLKFRCKHCGYEHVYGRGNEALKKFLICFGNGEKEGDPEYDAYVSDLKNGKYGPELQGLLTTEDGKTRAYLGYALYKCFGCNRVSEIRERTISRQDMNHAYYLNVHFIETCPLCGNSYAFKKYMSGPVLCPECGELAYEAVERWSQH